MTRGPHARLFDTDLPVVQAPMAGVQGSALAVAVSNGGGLGSLPCATLDRDALRRELEVIRARTTRPFNVNVFCHAEPVRDASREAAWLETLAPYFQEFGVEPAALDGPARRPFDADVADVLAEFAPPVVSFHFGLPAPALLARVRDWGATILASATTVDEGVWLEARGVDAVIAQGWEAGGHRGTFLSEDLTTQVDTMTLVLRLVRALGVPIIAAGGIGDARGVAAALRLGAAAVQVGTAYLRCPECTTTPLHRAALAGDAPIATAVTNVLTGRPARGIVTRLMRELGPMHASVPDFPIAAAALAPLRSAAERQGRTDFSTLWAGTHAAGCQAIPADRLTRALAGAPTA